jgi:hypothetical protein
MEFRLRRDQPGRYLPQEITLSVGALKESGAPAPSRRIKENMHSTQPEFELRENARR